MASSSVEERVRAIAERVAIDNGLELVHAEVAGPDNKPIVRIFIDKPNGVTHQDCSEVSLHVGTVLDVEDFIHAAYTLEVSSPGVDEPLKLHRQYTKNIGRTIEVTMNDGTKKEGKLTGVDDDEISIEERTGQGKKTVIKTTNILFNQVKHTKVLVTF